MARCFVKGMGAITGHYLKPGYNVLRRYKKGTKPDDDLDLFEWLGYNKTKKEAEKRKKSIKDEVGFLEIVAFKKPKKDI